MERAWQWGELGNADADLILSMVVIGLAEIGGGIAAENFSLQAIWKLQISFKCCFYLYIVQKVYVFTHISMLLDYIFILKEENSTKDSQKGLFIKIAD